jgi:hypothetical protein
MSNIFYLDTNALKNAYDAGGAPLIQARSA